jgi:drug/metabolite transporter (DMT)-like permease
MSTAPSDGFRLKLALALGAIYLLWGSTYFAVKIAVTTMPPFAMVALRFTLAGVALYGWLHWRGWASPTARQWRDNAVVGLALLVGGNGIVSWVAQYMASGLIALIIGAAPIFMVLTEWAWPGGSRPRPGTLPILIMGAAGVAWLAWPGEVPPAATVPLWGLGLILFSSLCWSVGAIYSRHTKEAAPPLMAAAMQMLVGGGVLFVFATALGDWSRWELSTTAPEAWLSLAYLVVFGSLIGFSTFAWLLKNCAPALLSTHTFVNPVIALLLGWIWLDEVLTPRVLGASALIIGAVALVTLRYAGLTPRPTGPLPVPPKPAVS